MKTFSIITSVLFFLSFFSSCEKEGSEKKISSYNSNKSHNTGQNCMNCHKPGGEGDGQFTVAGSVFKPDLSTANSNNTIYLYSGQNGTGTLKATLQGDAKGNFYTTEAVDFSSGLYPYLKNQADSTVHMSGSVSTGACNSCHGISQDKLWNY
jgi:hypothetical protein